MKSYAACLISPGNPSFGRIISGYLYGYAVSNKDSDAVFSNLSTDRGNDLNAILKKNLKHCSRKVIRYRST